MFTQHIGTALWCYLCAYNLDFRKTLQCSKNMCVGMLVLCITTGAYGDNHNLRIYLIKKGRHIHVFPSAMMRELEDIAY